MAEKLNPPEALAGVCAGLGEIGRGVKGVADFFAVVGSAFSSKSGERSGKCCGGISLNVSPRRVRIFSQI